MPARLRLDIARKMLLGYVPLAVLITALGVYTLRSLERLRQANSAIVTADLPLIEISDALQHALHGQELSGRRYLSIRLPELQQDFWEKSEEFHRHLGKLHALLGGSDPAVDRLAAIHAEYNRLFIIDFRMAEGKRDPGREYSEVSRMRHREMVEITGDIARRVRERLQEKNEWAARFGVRAIRVTLFGSLLGILMGLGSAAAITRDISRSVRGLKEATALVAEGEFDNLPTVATRDELGELSRSFAEMAAKLKRLEELALDANPLSRLPGGRAIQSALESRIQADAPFAFCLVDLDHFKAFNDRYGYARGNDVIRRVAGIMREAVAETASGDFVGHVGGDDFVLVTSETGYERLCQRIIDTFDREIPGFYAEEDRQRGYIVGKTRQGQTMSFPVMSISIGVVTTQRQRFASHVEVSALAAELKEFAKSMPGSHYVVDRRGGASSGAAAGPRSGGEQA